MPEAARTIIANTSTRALQGLGAYYLVSKHVLIPGMLTFLFGRPCRLNTVRLWHVFILGLNTMLQSSGARACHSLYGGIPPALWARSKGFL